MYNGLFGLNIKPYIKNVKLCYKCLRYGHRKAQCRAEANLCFICSQDYHGACNINRTSQCINCGESHPSTDRICIIYQMESLTNKIAAYKNKSFVESRNLATSELGLNVRTDVYNKNNDSTDDEEENIHLDSDEYPKLGGYKKRAINVEKWENKAVPVNKKYNPWERNKKETWQETKKTERDIKKSIESVNREEEREKRIGQERISQTRYRQEELNMREGLKQETEAKLIVRKEDMEESMIEEILSMAKEHNITDKLARKLQKANEYKNGERNNNNAREKNRERDVTGKNENKAGAKKSEEKTKEII